MDIVNDFIGEYINYIVLLSTIINIFVLLIIVINSMHIKKVKSKINILNNGIENESLEKIIIGYYKEVKEIIEKNKDIEEQIVKINAKLTMSLQKIGVVRYNAFEDVGSDLSFAITALDSNDNGFVINAVYSRESSIIYAKPIIDGKSKYALSAEEVQSIDLAKKNYSE